MRRVRRLVRWLILGRTDGLRSRARRRAVRCAQRASGRAAGSAERPADTDGSPSIPEGFEPVIRVDELKPGALLEVIVGGQALALANVDGAFHAVSDVCPHAGGALGEGYLDGPVLTCPLHGWTFDVRDGACHVDPAARLRTYDVCIVDDRVCVRVVP